MTIINLRVSTRMIYPPKSEIFSAFKKKISRTQLYRKIAPEKNQNCLIFQVFLCYINLSADFFHRYFKTPLFTDNRRYRLTLIQTHKQAKTRAGGQVVEEDDKVEAEETEEEKHYVPYYL